MNLVSLRLQSRNYTEMMNQLLVSILSIIALAGCGSGETTQTPEQNAEAEKTAVTQNGGGLPTHYVNGIDERNSGDKQGPIHLFGTTKNAPANTRMFLYETEGKTQSVIDSTDIVNGAWDFGTKEYKRGFYMMGYNGDRNNMFPVILNPDEAEVELNFNNIRLNAGGTAPQGSENAAWFTYRPNEVRKQSEIRQLQQKLRDAALRERIEQQIKEKENELKMMTAEAIKANPGTFLAKYLTWKNSPYPNDKGRYWEDIDFTDESILRTPIMNDRVQEFMRTHSGGEFSGFINCVDLVKAKAEVNPVVLEFALFVMLDGFYQTGMEDVCQYILDNYIFDDDCGANLSDVVKQRAEGIVNLQIGKTPPNWKAPTPEGKVIDFMSEVKKNEYTLLFFWASWCHKCEQEMPVLNKVYDLYKSRGFNVVGFSVDGDRNQWLAGIESKQAGRWPNVSQLQSWDSPISREYRITQTPASFLMNRKGEIVLKPKRIFEVEQFLQKNL